MYLVKVFENFFRKFLHFQKNGISDSNGPHALGRRHRHLRILKTLFKKTYNFQTNAHFPAENKIFVYKYASKCH